MSSALKALNGLASVPFSPNEWFLHFRLGLQCLWPMTWRKFTQYILPILMWGVQIVNVAGLLPILHGVITTHAPSGTPMFALVGFLYIQLVVAIDSIHRKNWPLGIGMMIAFAVTLTIVTLSIIYA